MENLKNYFRSIFYSSFLIIVYLAVCYLSYNCDIKIVWKVTIIGLSTVVTMLLISKQIKNSGEFLEKDYDKWIEIYDFLNEVINTIGFVILFLGINLNDLSRSFGLMIGLVCLKLIYIGMRYLVLKKIMANSKYKYCSCE